MIRLFCKEKKLPQIQNPTFTPVPSQRPEIENGRWWRPIEFLAKRDMVTPNGVIGRWSHTPQEQPEAQTSAPVENKWDKSIGDPEYRLERIKACRATHKALIERYVKPPKEKAVA